MTAARGVAFAAAALALPACATVSAERGHAEVAELVEKRIGLRTSWERGSPADERLAARVAELLQGGLTRKRAVELALLNNPALQATYEELGVSEHLGHMKMPPNSIPMVGAQGKHDYITMGGMFTVLKVRDRLEGYADPGWYENPPGTLAEAAREADMRRDGIDAAAPPPGDARPTVQHG